MKKTIASIVIGLSIGIVMGQMHIQSSTETPSWAITNRPEPIRYEIKLEKIDSEADHYLHDMGYKLDDEIPEDIQRMAEYIGYEYGISPEFLEAVAYQESRFNPEVKSADGSCIGLMQVNPKWHKERMNRLGVTDLTDAQSNMMVAADYLSYLFNKYEDPGVVLMKYNGDSRTEAYAQNGKLSGYAQEILDRAEEYEVRHGKIN